MKASRSGQAEAKASLTRLTLMLTRAQIVRSFSLDMRRIKTNAAVLADIKPGWLGR